jgi:hypothetical protein
LLDGFTGRPIADELYGDKSPETIKTFIGAHLDPTIQTFVVTDFYSIYPGVFGKFFGENLIHQLRLMHLSKLIVGVVKLQLQGGAAETVRWEFHARMVEWES